MMFADDTVGLLCGCREVNITEFLHTWKKINRRERGMRISRLKTKFMDFAFEHNE